MPTDIEISGFDLAFHMNKERLYGYGEAITVEEAESGPIHAVPSGGEHEMITRVTFEGEVTASFGSPAMHGRLTPDVFATYGAR